MRKVLTMCENRTTAATLQDTLREMATRLIERLDADNELQDDFDQRLCRQANTLVMFDQALTEVDKTTSSLLDARFEQLRACEA